MNRVQRILGNKVIDIYIHLISFVILFKIKVQRICSLKHDFMRTLSIKELKMKMIVINYNTYLHI